MDHLALGHHMLQEPEEFEGFCRLMEEAGARRYLEIGSWEGGSIDTAAEYLPKGSRIVSVEMPCNLGKYRTLQQVLGRLQLLEYETFLITGPSEHDNQIRLAAALGPYDAVFIDGGHTYECVRSDWENYGRLAPLVGFHDIAIDSPGHGVCRFWNELKGQYRHVEFISEETRRQTLGYGVGVVWPYGQG